jgi:putative phosphoesterase
MISLIQQNNNLIGSLDAIEALKTKDHARVIVISDSHGNFRLLNQIVQNFGTNCDALILCGDTGKDFAELIETAFDDADFKKTVPPVIACVKGNCDTPSVPISFCINDKPEAYANKSIVLPESQLLTVNGQNIFICHGNNEHVEYGYEAICNKMTTAKCKAAVYGHTHVPFNGFFKDNIRIINPGSISRPRDGYPETFAILTVEKTFIDAAFIKITRSLIKHISFSVIKNF